MSFMKFAAAALVALSTSAQAAQIEVDVLFDTDTFEFAGFDTSLGTLEQVTIFKTGFTGNFFADYSGLAGQFNAFYAEVEARAAIQFGSTLQVELGRRSTTLFCSSIPGDQCDISRFMFNLFLPNPTDFNDPSEHAAFEVPIVRGKIVREFTNVDVQEGSLVDLFATGQQTAFFKVVYAFKEATPDPGPAPVPLPASAFLLLSGLAPIVARRARSRKAR